MLPHRFHLLLSGLLLGAVVVWTSHAAEDEPPRKSTGQQPAQERPEEDDQERKGLNHFMRLKLGASGKILEGLATEDFDLIKEGARKLNQMSTAEKWRVTNDPLYRNFSGDFQRVTRDLVDAAQDENLDKAALKWMDATMGCIECHRYARGIMIASSEVRKSP